MRPQKVDRPLPLIVIGCFQFLKAGFLIGVATLLWIAPDALPHSETFSELLYIAAHGKDVSGILVPVLGCYMIYVGYGLFTLRPSTRANLAISSALTAALSLKKLGLFGDENMTSSVNRETLYILILLDLTIYIYMVYHPEIVSSFTRAKRPSPIHS